MIDEGKSQGNRTRHCVKYPRRINEAVQPELNLFAVQMVSQPPVSAIYIYLSGTIALFLK
ncbi:hypothetical protein JO41_02340 [Treponema sp. OMZ 838]|nr:hypothetical protein JO41_02340 [Treponema sp. OMZ 838]